MTNRYIWFKDGMIPANEAKIHALSPTAQFGLNVFEGLRGYFKEEDDEIYIFRMKDHLDRLSQSCRLIGLEMPHDVAAIESFVRETITRNSYREDLALRITVFLDGEGTWSTVRNSSLFIAPIAMQRRQAISRKPLSVTVSSWRRIDDLCMPPRIKCGANYINGRYAHLDAQAKGFDAPLFLGGDGKLSEGAGACLFLVRNGVLLTPPGTASILESITRDTLIELARAEGLTVEIRPLDRTELLMSEEAFLCGSAAEVSPIGSVDHVALGNEKAGPITRKLSDAYFKTVSQPNPARPAWTWPAGEKRVEDPV